MSRNGTTTTRDHHNNQSGYPFVSDKDDEPFVADPGSAQNCFKCGLAFYSDWVPEEPFSATKDHPDPEDLVCETCTMRELFDKNMAKLEAEEHKRHRQSQRKKKTKKRRKDA